MAGFFKRRTNQSAASLGRQPTWSTLGYGLINISNAIVWGDLRNLDERSIAVEIAERRRLILIEEKGTQNEPVPNGLSVDRRR